MNCVQTLSHADEDVTTHGMSRADLSNTDALSRRQCVGETTNQTRKKGNNEFCPDRNKQTALLYHTFQSLRKAENKIGTVSGAQLIFIGLHCFTISHNIS